MSRCRCASCALSIPKGPCTVKPRECVAAHTRSRVVHVSDSLFVTGDAVWSHCFAQRGSSRWRLPSLGDSMTPLPLVALCRPTTGVGHGDSRVLTLLGENSYTGPRSLVSLCRIPHDTAWVLRGVSTAALQTRAVPGTLVLSPPTHIWPWDARQGRSAWEPALPLGHYTF